MLLKEEREQVVEYGKQLLERNLSVGTFGNISIYNEKENLFESYWHWNRCSPIDAPFPDCWLLANP